MLKVKDCPVAPAALELLHLILKQEGVSDIVEVVEVIDLEMAKRERFLGSPSIQIDGMDIEMSRRGDMPLYGCRIYQTQGKLSGIPLVALQRSESERMIRNAVRRARSPKIKLLFLCTGNSCRSQMAEGWTQYLRGDQIDVYSAGIKTHELDPLAVKAMNETGVDISTHKSKNVSDLMHIRFDYVITVCDHAYENCPIFPDKLAIRPKFLHAGFDDPPRLAENAGTEEEAMVHYRRIRDEIHEYVESLPGTLLEEK